MLYSLFWVDLRRLNCTCRHFGTLRMFHLSRCSETSANKIQTPENHPKEIIQHSEHGQSLKSRIILQRCFQWAQKTSSYIRMDTFLYQKRMWLLFGCWCAHSNDPESYAGGSVATGRATHAGQVKGEHPDKERYPGPPGWGLGVPLATAPRKKKICCCYGSTRKFRTDARKTKQAIWNGQCEKD